MSMIEAAPIAESTQLHGTSVMMDGNPPMKLSLGSGERHGVRNVFGFVAVRIHTWSATEGRY
jgi:hypothetical protein